MPTMFTPAKYVELLSLQVNKPYLPVASGEYSVSTGVMIVTSFSIMVSIFKNILIHRLLLAYSGG
jgi:hypothetical protein